MVGVALCKMGVGKRESVRLALTSSRKEDALAVQCTDFDLAAGGRFSSLLESLRGRHHLCDATRWLAEDDTQTLSDDAPEDAALAENHRSPPGPDDVDDQDARAGARHT